MTDLFRFIMLRPPKVPRRGSYVFILPSENLERQLGDVLKRGVPPGQVAAVAQDLIARRADLVRDDRPLSYESKYTAFTEQLDDLTNAPKIPLPRLIEHIFERSPAALVQTPEFLTDKSRATDTLILAKLASDGTQVDVGRSNVALRATTVISSVAAGVTEPETQPVFVLAALPLARSTAQISGQHESPDLKVNTYDISLKTKPGPDDDPGTRNLPPLPTGPGSVVVPIGIGDLLVVKQRLKRYEGGDVAHIENVLKTESFKRDTRRLDRIQTTVTTETDVTTEEERDAQSTERFALQRESANTIKQDNSLKAGVAVSASYGPTVSVKANLDTASGTAKEDSTKQSTSYSKDVTSRAASKITTTTKQQQTMLTSNEYEEDIHHGFDNTTGSGNISGVYQWVDKVYEAQVYNYGTRLMFDVMVPEPAAFLISQMRNQVNGRVLPEKPVLPAFFLPEGITPDNYQMLAQLFGTSNLDPPPEQLVVVPKEFMFPEGGNSDGSPVVKSAELVLSAGYEAYCVCSTISVQAVAPPQNDPISQLAAKLENEWGLVVNDVTTPALDLRLTVGDVTHALFTGVAYAHIVGDPNVATKSSQMKNETGSVPVTLIASGLTAFTVAIEVYCRPTKRTCNAWQAKVHAAIMLDYQKRLADYERAVADAANDKVDIQGQDPLLNRVLEQTELKKACITLITGQQFESFGAVEVPPPGYPQVLLSNVEVQGRYARFLEEAFEWEQMMYFFYPYYWGRKARWPLHVLATDPDPLFSQFLNAGFARVVFPVRLKFDQAVFHLLESGQPWNGGDLPTITSDLYVSIVTEMKEQQGAPGAETAQGDPWEVKLPTTIVKLRSDDKLPSWGWNENKPPEWVEVAPG